MEDSKDTVRHAAEAAAETAKAILESHGLKYAGIAVVAELPKSDEGVTQTGCWVCVRDEGILKAVNATLIQAVERMVQYESPDVPPSEPN